MLEPHSSEVRRTPPRLRNAMVAGLTLGLGLLAVDAAHAAPKMPPDPSPTQLEGVCNEHGGIYSPPNINGVYWCLFPDGTLVACGGLLPFCTQSYVYQDKTIGLSDVQTVKLRRLTTDYERSRIRTQASLDLAELETQALLHGEKSDLAPIADAVKKAEAARVDLRVSGIQALREAFAVLSQEQVDQLWALIETRYGDRGQGGCKPPPHQCSKGPAKQGRL